MTRPEWSYEREFDGGDAGCGEVLLDLRMFVQTLPRGTRVLVIARDEGAPIELPAWCRMTGHRLLADDHPFYLLATK